MSCFKVLEEKDETKNFCGKISRLRKYLKYQLEIADQTILLSTALLSGSIALAGLFSALKEKIKIEKRKQHGFTQILKKI